MPGEKVPTFLGANHHYFGLTELLTRRLIGECHHAEGQAVGDWTGYVSSGGSLQQIS